MIIADFSAGRPGVKALRAAGFDGAMRYVGFNRLKCMTEVELAEYRRENFPVGAVFEDTVRNWRGGATAGKYDAYTARGYCNSIGFPEECPIYMAIDQEILTKADLNIAMDYLSGARDALGGTQNTGVYGQYLVVKEARLQGIVRWTWQTTAWSHGKIFDQRNIFQTLSTRYAGTVRCDVNEVFTADWGQIIMASDFTDQFIVDLNKGMSDWDTTAPAERRNARTWAAELRLSQANTEAQTARMNLEIGHLTDAVTLLSAELTAIKQRLDDIAHPERIQQIIREAFAAELPNLHIRGV